ncbi:MAG: hypothetical protein IH856_21850 [Deltaproteobacteria bacterium]|nr:hypothetical protein [Deltaproteobacteria bacterium]
MDYAKLDKAAERGVITDKPVLLNIRRLSTKEAKGAIEPWTSSSTFKSWGVNLFGRASAKCWTFAILSSLKKKANEIEPGRLEWILRTALPLRDDFSIYLNGMKLLPSKAGRGLIKKWILGRDLKTLAKPASDEIQARVASEFPKGSPEYYGLYHPLLGRITGYAEAYHDVLTTGKSERLGRSYGFFVYVYGRLINIDEEYFGVDSNLLRHGTFSRFRLVINIDKLDEELRSTRDSIREGPICTETRNVLHAIFNFVRPKIEAVDKQESRGARAARKVAGTPGSLTRRPIVELTRLALAGRARPRYLQIPPKN